MNRKHRIIQWLLVVVLLSGIVSYFFFATTGCYQKIEFKINYPSDSLFNEKDLSEFVKKNCPKVIGKPIDSVNLTYFEHKVGQFPYLESADVINVRGTLVIKANQHKILARVYNQDNHQYYLTENGKLTPVSNYPSGRVVIVNGYLSDLYSPKTDLRAIDTIYRKNDERTPIPRQYPALYTVWKILQYIHQNEFWQAEIGQIYVNKKQEVILSPVVGNHVVTFGRLDAYLSPEKDIDAKFKNLKDIYEQGFPIKGWDAYEHVNLNFGREIPCKQRSKN